MEITDVRIKLATSDRDNLRAYCTIVIDDSFVVTDLKVVDGNKGMFVSMPSRKVMDKCPKCRSKNHIRARFCNDCGKKLDNGRFRHLPEKRLYVDMAHPIKADCRQQIVKAVLDAYYQECELTDVEVGEVEIRETDVNDIVDYDTKTGQIDPSGLDADDDRLYSNE